MRTIHWHLSNGIAGADQEGEFEIEDNTSNDEIEELAREAAFDCIDWWWDEK